MKRDMTPEHGLNAASWSPGACASEKSGTEAARAMNAWAAASREAVERGRNLRPQDPDGRTP